MIYPTQAQIWKMRKHVKACMKPKPEGMGLNEDQAFNRAYRLWMFGLWDKNGQLKSRSVEGLEDN